MNCFRHRILWIALLVACSEQPLICNGYEELCDRHYNEVAYATTHNAMSNEDEKWILPNQIHGIEQQLQDGIRAMMLDVYIEKGDLALCHAFCDLGIREFADALQAINTFLEENSGEVFTFLFQDAAPQDDIVAALQANGFADKLVSHTLGEPWPTLREMAKSGRRVVAFAEAEGEQNGDYLHMWDHVWDTNFGHESAEKMEGDCAPNRGNVTNSLFLINHFITPALLEAALTVNGLEFLSSRVGLCQQQSGQIPNFVAVDFYSMSAVSDVVNMLNATAR